VNEQRDSTNLVYVSNAFANDVVVINGNTNSIVAIVKRVEKPC